MKKFDKFCEIINNIAAAITVTIMVFLIILITWSVISRYCFNNPVAWQYEATLVCLSWVVFIGMSITFHNDEHMRLTFVSNAMKPKMRAIWLTIMDAFCFVFLIVAGYLAIGVVQNSMGTLYQTIPVARGWFSGGIEDDKISNSGHGNLSGTHGPGRTDRFLISHISAHNNNDYRSV